MESESKFNWKIYMKFWFFGLVLGMLLLNSVSAELIEKPVELWNKTAGGSSGDKGAGVTVDSDDNIIITGVTNNIYSADVKTGDIWTIKYDPDGNVIWNKTLGGSGREVSIGIVADSNDNIIITGHTDPFSNGGSDIWTIKYDPDGNVIWNKTVGGSGHDEGYSVSVDSDNNIIVAGFTESFGAENADILVIKYSPKGDMQWNKTLGGSGRDEGKGVAVDSNNNIIVIGITTSFNGGDWNSWMIKYDPNGNLIWNKVGNNTGMGYGIAIDSNNNIIVTGCTDSFDSEGYAIWTIKYDPDGNALWDKKANRNSSDQSYGVALDSNDNIIVTGKTGPFYSVGYDIWIIKYNPHGNMSWNKTVGGSGWAMGFGVALDSNDNIIVTGYKNYFIGPCDKNSCMVGKNDVWTIKYTTLEVEEEKVEEKVEEGKRDNIEEKLEGKNPTWKTYIIIGMIILGLILLFILFRRWKKAIM